MIPKTKKYQGGGEIVEVALVLPLLFFLIFGIINGGWAIFSYNTLVAATREGARYGSVLGTKSGETTVTAPPLIIARVRQQAVGVPLVSKPGETNPQVLYPNGNNERGSTVTVITTFTFTPIAPFFGPKIDLTSQASMIIFY